MSSSRAKGLNGEIRNVRTPLKHQRVVLALLKLPLMCFKIIIIQDRCESTVHLVLTILSEGMKFRSRIKENSCYYIC